MGGDLDLKVFTDADWAGNIDDRKRTSGGHSFSARDLCHGQVRNKIAFINLLQR